MTSPLMPAAFLGHGTPMNALDHNRHTAAWRAFGASVPRPRAILVVSAHWHIAATAVTAMPLPRTIHDFYGFPPELFAMQYPAPGLPALAEEIADALQPDQVSADHGSWGLDHGTWSVLCHAFPKADIPVVQLSLNATKPLDYHLQLGAKLAALRSAGVLVVGSGNVVHNLRALDWNASEAGFDWAHRFDDAARELMLGDPAGLGRLLSHRDWHKAVPTDEHFLPLAYIAGFAAETKDPVKVLTDGYAFGSLSMTAYTVGADCAKVQAGLPGATPSSNRLDGDQTNL